MQRKLMGISVDFDITGTPETINSTFVKYSRKYVDTVRMFTSYL
jgi:hypothetical protein